MKKYAYLLALVSCCALVLQSIFSSASSFAADGDGGRSVADANRMASREAAIVRSSHEFMSNTPGVDGSYFDHDGRLHVVAKTDAAAEKVRKAGYIADRRSYGESDLLAQFAKVKHLARDLAPVVSIGPDLSSGYVSATVIDGQPMTESAIATLEEHGVHVQKIEARDAPRPAVSSIAGWTILNYSASERCTAGFNAIIGLRSSPHTVMLEAGHCTQPAPGAPIYQVNTGGPRLGTSQYSRYNAGYDYGAVDYYPTVSTPARVDDRQGGTISVIGSYFNSWFREGQVVCKYGITTGVTCGYINSFFKSVKYGTTLVHHLVRASLCILAGDSGAPVLINSQAAGIISGGQFGYCGYNSIFSDNHTGITYFAPIQDALDWYHGYVKVE